MHRRGQRERSQHPHSLRSDIEAWRKDDPSDSGSIEQLTSGDWLLARETEEKEAEIEMSEEVIRLLGILRERE